MNLEIFALCDAATVAGGKLNILGAFDSVFANQAPGTHAQCAVAMRLRFSRLEEGEHRLKLTIVDADGKAIMNPLEGATVVKFSGDEESTVANFIINIQQLKLSQFGAYSINLALDDRHVAALPLMFKLMPGRQ